MARRFQRIRTGLYRLKNWSVYKLEVGDRDSYYKWAAEWDGLATDENRELFRTRSEAISFVIKSLDFIDTMTL